MAEEFSLIAEEFESDLQAIKSLVNAFDEPQSSGAKARVAAANAATLLLAATFEEFVREMARTYAISVVAQTSSFDELPPKLAVTAWKRTLEGLAKIKFNQRPIGGYDSIFSEAFDKFSVIHKFCSGDLSQNIYDDLIHNDNNMRPGEINSMFKISNITDICSRISEQTVILEYFGENEVGKAHGRLLVGLENFFERRNGIAHSLNPSQSSGTDQIIKDIDMFAAIASSMCKCLERNSG